MTDKCWLIHKRHTHARSDEAKRARLCRSTNFAVTWVLETVWSTDAWPGLEEEEEEEIHYVHTASKGL